MTIKTLAAFLLGVAAGGVSGYFLTRETMKTKQQLEINEMREYYKKKYGVKEEAPKPVEPPKVKETGKDIYEKIDMVAQDYHAESKMISEENDKETKLFKSTYQKPYEITEEEYNNETKWLKLEYIWYYHHKVMMDTTDDEPSIIEDPYVQVGLDNLEALEESGDGYIYVRNDNRGELYFVTLSANAPNINPETYKSPLPEDDEDDIY